jgi:hypothetical protein
MNIEPITAAKTLIRLSNHKIGVREATCLFLCIGGATNSSVAKAAKEPGYVVRNRLISLRNKELIEVVERKDKANIYRPTLRGQTIINHVLGRVLS